MGRVLMGRRAGIGSEQGEEMGGEGSLNPQREKAGEQAYTRARTGMDGGLPMRTCSYFPASMTVIPEPDQCKLAPLAFLLTNEQTRSLHSPSQPL